MKNIKFLFAAVALFFVSTFVSAQVKDWKEKNEFHKVYYHTLGKSQSEDELIYEDKAHADRNFSAQVTHDENYLVIYGSESTSGQSMMIKDLSNPQNKFIPVVTNFDNIDIHIIFAEDIDPSIFANLTLKYSYIIY